MLYEILLAQGLANQISCNIRFEKDLLRVLKLVSTFMKITTNRNKGQ